MMLRMLFVLLLAGSALSAKRRSRISRQQGIEPVMHIVRYPDNQQPALVAPASEAGAPVNSPVFNGIAAGHLPLEGEVAKPTFAAVPPQQPVVPSGPLGGGEIFRPSDNPSQGNVINNNPAAVTYVVVVPNGQNAPQHGQQPPYPPPATSTFGSPRSYGSGWESNSVRYGRNLGAVPSPGELGFPPIMNTHENYETDVDWSRVGRKKRAASKNSAASYPDSVASESRRSDSERRTRNYEEDEDKQEYDGPYVFTQLFGPPYEVGYLRSPVPSKHMYDDYLQFVRSWSSASKDAVDAQLQANPDAIKHYKSTAASQYDEPAYETDYKKTESLKYDKPAYSEPVYEAKKEAYAPPKPTYKEPAYETYPEKPAYDKKDPYEAPKAYEKEYASAPKYEAPKTYDEPKTYKAPAAYEAPKYDEPKQGYLPTKYEAPKEVYYSSTPRPNYEAPKSYDVPKYESPKAYEKPAYDDYEAPKSYDSPKYEAPKYETPKYETPKYESAKYDEPKYDTPKYEAPKYEAPKYETPKYEAPKYETPKYEAPKYETPKYEAPKYETPKYEAPKYETPKYETPKYETPKYETPKYETPKYEAPKYETPKYETPKYETPKYETPKYEAPKYETPKYETPKYETPKYEAPKYEAPAYETPKYEPPKYSPPKYDSYDEPKAYDTPKYEVPKSDYGASKPSYDAYEVPKGYDTPKDTKPYSEPSRHPATYEAHKPVYSEQKASTYKETYSSPAYRDSYTTPAYKDPYASPAYNKDNQYPAQKDSYTTPSYKEAHSSGSHRDTYTTPAYEEVYSSSPVYKETYTTPAYKESQAVYKDGYSTPSYKDSSPVYKDTYNTPGYSSQSYKETYSNPSYSPASKGQSGTSYPKDSYDEKYELSSSTYKQSSHEVPKGEYKESDKSYETTTRKPLYPVIIGRYQVTDSKAFLPIKVDGKGDNHGASYSPPSHDHGGSQAGHGSNGEEYVVYYLPYGQPLPVPLNKRDAKDSKIVTKVRRSANAQYYPVQNLLSGNDQAAGYPRSYYYPETPSIQPQPVTDLPKQPEDLESPSTTDLNDTLSFSTLAPPTTTLSEVEIVDLELVLGDLRSSKAPVVSSETTQTSLPEVTTPWPQAPIHAGSSETATTQQEIQDSVTENAILVEFQENAPSDAPLDTLVGNVNEEFDVSVPSLPGTLEQEFQLHFVAPVNEPVTESATTTFEPIRMDEIIARTEIPTVVDVQEVVVTSQDSSVVEVNQAEDAPVAMTTSTTELPTSSKSSEPIPATMIDDQLPSEPSPTVLVTFPSTLLESTSPKTTSPLPTTSETSASVTSTTTPVSPISSTSSSSNELDESSEEDESDEVENTLIGGRTNATNIENLAEATTPLSNPSSSSPASKPASSEEAESDESSEEEWYEQEEDLKTNNRENIRSSTPSYQVANVGKVLPGLTQRPVKYIKPPGLASREQKHWNGYSTWWTKLGSNVAKVYNYE